MLQLSLKPQRSFGKNIGRPRRRTRRIMHNNVQEILTLNYDYKAPAFGDSAFVPAWRRASWRKKYRAERKILAQGSPADAKLYYTKFLALSRSE